jgi:hypothetical protein
MTPWIKVALIGSFAVIVFDVAASIASRAFSFPYTKASIGSFAIYFAVGYFAARATDQSRVWAALLADVFVGFTDGTIGWAVSFLIGPGRPKTELTFGRWLFSCGFVILTAVILGVVASLFVRNPFSPRG